MSIQITMPALSPTMEEGNLAKWLVKIGDHVEPGQVIAEIETDKATMEVEAVDEGVVAEILVPEGSEGVKVNTPIATLRGEGETAPKETSKPPSRDSEEARRAEQRPTPKPAATATESRSATPPQAERPPPPTPAPQGGGGRVSCAFSQAARPSGVRAVASRGGARAVESFPEWPAFLVVYLMMRWFIYATTQS